MRLNYIFKPAGDMTFDDGKPGFYNFNNKHLVWWNGKTSKDKRGFYPMWYKPVVVSRDQTLKQALEESETGLIKMLEDNKINYANA